MLPTSGDSLAPPRPDRAEPPVLALTAVRQERFAPAPLCAVALAPAEPVPPEDIGLAEEPRGCLYALSQPPLMLFLCVIAALIGLGAAWDMLFV